MKNRAWWTAAAGIAAGAAAYELYRKAREQDLRGSVVLITGGSRGLGLALARRFAKLGCRIAICARDEAELQQAVDDLRSRGAEALAVRCDVTDPAQVDRAVSETLAHYGGIDILVNNAGIIQVGPVESMSTEDFRRAMDVMFWGTVHPTMAVLPHFVARGSGRIVNITSIGGKVSVPHLVPYSCAKFAAVAFSEGLRAEFSGRGIQVTTIAPGLMRTGSYLNAEFGGDHDKESAWFGLSASLPLISMSGERAARQIVAATRRGEAERILTTPAMLLARFHGLFPGITSNVLAAVNRSALPRAANGGKVPGSRTVLTRSRVLNAATLLGRAAAKRFMQPQSDGGRTLPGRVPVGGR